ncbi:hypothetical protein CDL15_Pgr004585 [Punica granatum]|uniref:Pentatricopeptide repeat-containing protein At4g01570 n=1 Tax=Punica granatum TaxID=22663 RepID=A0A218WQR8_PUNGR|nr:hypothetical protein CDL15_Pgr004585 [Punica granatum]
MSVNANILRKHGTTQLAEILLEASVTKSLAVSGTGDLDPHSVPLSESLLHRVLRSPSLHPSKKLELFAWARSVPSLGHFYKHSAGTYSLMFYTLCRSDHLEEVPPLINLMKEDGVVVDSWTFKLVLDSLIRAGKFDAALDILGHMEELGVKPNSRMYDSVLVAFVRKGKLGLALSMFCKLLDASDFNSSSTDGVHVGSVPGLTACNELLGALKKADMRAEFRDLFCKLREKDWFELDTVGYNICIHGFGCWGDLTTSLKLFEEMKAKSLKSGSFGPDLCTYNSLIQVLCLSAKVKDALTVYEEMKGSGHEPDSFTYRILIQGCSKSYRMDDAMRIHGEMEYNGFRPDVVVYNALLDGLLKSRRVVEACGLFEKLVEDGVRASCCTYNILIDGLFKNGRAEGAYTLFCDLKKKGHFVDGITYSIVVIQLCKEGLVDEAFDLVKEMEARGFVVDLVTVTSLLIGFHKHGYWDGAEMLMKHIRDGNLVPNILKWKANMEAVMKNPQSRRKDYTPLFPSRGDLSEVMSLISSSESGREVEETVNVDDNDEWSSSPYMDQLASKAKSGDLAPQLFSIPKAERVLSKGVDSFDIDMVNTFLSIFLAKGKISLACKLFEIFTDMGVDPTSYTYNSIMSSFVKKGYLSEAWSVLNEMGEKICPWDIATYNAIIQGLGKMGRADLASSVHDKLIKHGGYLDIVMYNTLINALGSAGRIEEACGLFGQMRASGIKPDVVTFNTLIKVHTKAGKLKEAYKFLRMMLDEGCSPNHVTDTTLDLLGREIEKLRYRKASIMGPHEDDSN